MTCKNKKEDIDLAFDLGADDYIVKPFKLSELKKKITDLLKKTQ
jgi:DNA-binding response OmpR family regulator